MNERRVSIQGRLSECSRIMAAKKLKNPYRISDIQIFLKEEVNQNTKRKNRKLRIQCPW